MQLGDLNSSLLDLLVGMAAPSKEGLVAAAPDAAAFAETLASALEAGSALGGARPAPAPTSEDDAPTDEPTSLVMGDGPRVLDPVDDLLGGLGVRPVGASGDRSHDVSSPPMTDDAVAADDQRRAPASPVAVPLEGASRDTPVPPRDWAALLLGSANEGFPVSPTEAASPAPVVGSTSATKAPPESSPATGSWTALAEGAGPQTPAPTDAAKETPAPTDATKEMPSPGNAVTKEMPAPATAAARESAPSSPLASTVLRAVTESSVVTASSNDPGREALPRAEVATLLERIELRPSPSPDATASLRARLQPEDLGRSLAIRSLASAAPADPTPSSRVGAPVVAKVPVAGSSEPSVEKPVPAAPAAVAMAALAGSTLAATDSSSASTAEPAPSEPMPAVTPAPVDPTAEKQSGSRPESVPRPVAAPAAATVAPSGSAQGEGDASQSSSDADARPESDLPPPSTPAPSSESSAPTLAAAPRGADLQMQARQAVARTVVRMGEDQLLASARPQTATVQLRPSHLGELRIEVHQTPQRTLEITLTASVSETQRALEADADDMLDALRSQKLDVGRVSVRADGERPDSDPRGRNDFFRNRDPRDPSFAQGEGNPDRESGEHSRDGRRPSHADPTDYRYWEAIR